ncbi:hypothetical protein CHLRE_06g278279v5 [Chlamydomonas reinhardtii]|uniref:Uncharacterized protein n=1 Tax=Chlamydomonas reinhardtii TaxID=3055 RepID=A0A2K3DPC7_CHLRE|nr:uncharacterized protein CHLRE_06g278279v5 [Chlamydomonas reinhardtii]PNW82393.1 hypothetical protein CHLRE_06g278279v5 [Chlamydomonas reinhardtii]
MASLDPRLPAGAELRVRIKGVAAYAAALFSIFNPPSHPDKDAVNMATAAFAAERPFTVGELVLTDKGNLELSVKYIKSVQAADPLLRGGATTAASNLDGCAQTTR